MAYAVELKNITKTFPGVVANQKVSMRVEWGSIHGLIGENGAGKTTLMKVLYGMYHPDEGEILIDGHSVHLNSSKDAIEHSIGMVHQHFMLIPALTVIENAYLEPGFEGAKPYDSFQFVRNGYFCVDSHDSEPDHLVFNRIVSLKSSFKLPK